MPKPPPRISAFPGALDWYAEELGLKRKELARLERLAARNGKRAAELAKMRTANAVFEAMEGAIKDGKTLLQVRNALKKKLVDASDINLKLAFTNNVQRAYNSGRLREFTEPETLELRPYWAFDATMDHRTSAICRHCNGTVLPANSAWWKTHLPPLHHGCRSTFRAITRAEAARLGIDQRGPRAPAQDGFGKLSDALPRPDLKNVDPGLKASYRAKTRG